MEENKSNIRIMAEAMEIAISAATKYLEAQGCKSPKATMDHIFDHGRILGDVSGQITVKFRTREEQSANEADARMEAN